MWKEKKLAENEKIIDGKLFFTEESPKIKIFGTDDNKTVSYIDAIKECIKEGYKVAPLLEVWELKVSKKIPEQWYDSSSFLIEGEFKNLTSKELLVVDKLQEEMWEKYEYWKGLSRLYLNSDLDLYLYYNNLALSNSEGRVVGIKE